MNECMMQISLDVVIVLFMLDFKVGARTGLAQPEPLREPLRTHHGNQGEDNFVYADISAIFIVCM